MTTQQRGFSLIEVLFAVLILSVGILGMAGLQVTSVQQNRSSLLRAQAVQLANSMLDRMRANNSTTYGPVAFTDAPNTSYNCIVNSCTVAQMAEFDIAEWKCTINSTDGSGATYSACKTLGISGQLPGGEGAITISGGSEQVSVRWQDSPKGNQNTITIATKTR